MLNEKEKQMAAYWLDEASDMYANHGCNDVEEKVWDGWIKEERLQFVKEFHEYNGDPEEFDPNFLHLPDYAIMGFLAYKFGCGEAGVSVQLPPTNKAEENYKLLLKEYHTLDKQFTEWKSECSEHCKETHETIRKLKALKSWQ